MTDTLEPTKQCEHYNIDQHFTPIVIDKVARKHSETLFCEYILDGVPSINSLITNRGLSGIEVTPIQNIIS